MSELFQVYEDDLLILERELPAIMDQTLLACNDPLTRKRWEAVSQIVKNIRWNYGPPSEVETIE